MSLEGCVQNVAGVRWCRVTHFIPLPVDTDPATWQAPASASRQPQINAATDQLLALHAAQLALSPMASATTLSLA